MSRNPILAFKYNPPVKEKSQTQMSLAFEHEEVANELLKISNEKIIDSLNIL